jgi:hypothetical protein
MNLPAININKINCIKNVEYVKEFQIAPKALRSTLGAIWFLHSFFISISIISFSLRDNYVDEMLN